MIDILIVGAGPAGIEAAREARRQGFQVALVGMTPVGGRAAMGSLLPSKVWLHSAAQAGSGSSTVETITGEIRSRQQQWTQSLGNEFAEGKIPVYHGRAVMASATEVDIHSPHDNSVTERVTARSILIATGSEPTFPDNVKPDGTRIIAPRHTQALTEIPEHIVFVGDGVTSTEYASAFARLGSKVEIFALGDTLLPQGEVTAGRFITEYLEHQLGVLIHRNQMVVETNNNGTRVHTRTSSGTTAESDYVFIATGRHPDLSVVDEGPGELAGQLSRTPDGGLVTDGNGKTTVETIFAAGDATGPPLIANKATWQARRAVKYIAGAADSDLPPSYNIVHAVYTHPQVAWIGPVSELTTGETEKTAVLERDYKDLLIARIDHAENGFLKLWYNRDSRTIVGASAGGQTATELMTPIQLAMHTGLTIDQLTEIPGPHPTFSEIIGI